MLPTSNIWGVDAEIRHVLWYFLLHTYDSYISAAIPQEFPHAAYLFSLRPCLWECETLRCPHVMRMLMMPLMISVPLSSTNDSGTEVNSLMHDIDTWVKSGLIYLRKSTESDHHHHHYHRRVACRLLGHVGSVPADRRLPGHCWAAQGHTRPCGGTVKRIIMIHDQLRTDWPQALQRTRSLSSKHAPMGLFTLEFASCSSIQFTWTERGTSNGYVYIHKLQGNDVRIGTVNAV